MDLETALSLATSRSRTQRKRCWTEAVPEALQNGEPPNAVLLAQAVAHQVEHDHGADLLQPIEAIAKRSDIGEAFVRALAPRLIAVSAAATAAKPSATGSAVVLALRMLCAALRGSASAIGDSDIVKFGVK